MNDYRSRFDVFLKSTFAIDTRALSAFRVALSLIVIADLYLRLPYAIELLTDEGPFRRSLVAEYYGWGADSIYFLSGQPWFAHTVMAVNLLAALALLFGYKTRLALLICWILLFSIQNRNIMVLSSADVLLRCLMFWALFLPLNRYFSIDSALTNPKHRPLKAPKLFYSFGSAAMVMQILYVYWVGALLKTGTSWTTDYNAVDLALRLEQFSTKLGIWFASNFSFALPSITWIVYYLELFAPAIILAPFLRKSLRTPVVLALVTMHLGFLILLEVGIFPFVSVASLLLLFPSSAIDKLLQVFKTRRPQKIEIYYDEGCDFCLKTVCILRQLLLLPSDTRQYAAQSAEKAIRRLFVEKNSWVVRINGKVFTEWEALYQLSKVSPLKLIWIAPISLVHFLGLGMLLYRLIGSNRVRLGKVSKIFLPWTKNVEQYKSKPSMALVGIMAIVVFLANIKTLTSTQSLLHRIAHEIALHANLSQHWTMFAPNPLAYTQWPVMEGITNSNATVDLYNQKIGSVQINKPKDVYSYYKYYRIRKLYQRLFLDKYDFFREPIVRYQCKKWNSEQSSQNKVQTASFYVVEIPSLAPQLVSSRQLKEVDCLSQQ